MKPLIKKLLKAFKPGLFGDPSRKALQERLEEYLCEAEAKLKASPLADEKIAEATEAWVRYRGYSDAYDNVMGRAESVSVGSEGSVAFGDRSALLRELARSRNQWLDAWNALRALPAETPGTGTGLGTHALPTDYVF